MYIAPCHLTNGTIALLQENAHFLFSLEDVKKIIGDDYTAQMVLEEVADFFEDIEVDDDQQEPPTSLSDLDSFWDYTTPLNPLNEGDQSRDEAMETVS
jgi:hypothetical protein